MIAISGTSLPGLVLYVLFMGTAVGLIIWDVFFRDPCKDDD